MATIDGIDPLRLKEVERIREQGENPYPYSYEVSATTTQIQDKGKKLEPGESLEDRVGIAGRVMAVRDIGKIAFLDLQDQHGRVQLCVRKNHVGAEAYNRLKKVATGDIIGVEGNIARTRRGEVSVDVDDHALLAKALRHLPEKFHGLKDKETRYRQRELDLIVNPDSKAVFLKRSRAIALMRNYLDAQSFVEVEVPTLQTIYGGASARPFTTQLNALGIPLYLSISPELYLKRLIVGGIDRNYTICKNFRNEGIDKTHNPEFTMMECYAAFWDYNDMMRLTEEMYEHIFREVNGKTTVTYDKKELDFAAPWERRTMYDAIKQATGVDVANMDRDEIIAAITEHGLKGVPYVAEEDTRGELVQEIFEGNVEDTLTGPIFITDHPKESTPLCKGHRKDPNLIERFEPFAAGMEIGNAYSELNDPVLQRQLFEEQAAKLRDGNEEAHPMDHEFVRALEYGRPPTGGLGLGIDRMVMLLTEQYSIRDVILYPFMRPE
ncbi:lysine--tRNA ligase [Candidatus Woesearchaeota archaeon]|nr:lysine--tRNA ligase [Candidatus Woesearchaeota archaeon]